MTPICVECEAPLKMPAKLLVGEILSCAACGVDLEVRTVDPITVSLAPEIEEDWGE